jgi:hypothetical protein
MWTCSSLGFEPFSRHQARFPRRSHLTRRGHEAEHRKRRESGSNAHPTRKSRPHRGNIPPARCPPGRGGSCRAFVRSGQGRRPSHRRCGDRGFSCGKEAEDLRPCKDILPCGYRTEGVFRHEKKATRGSPSFQSKAESNDQAFAAARSLATLAGRLSLSSTSREFILATTASSMPRATRRFFCRADGVLSRRWISRPGAILVSFKGGSHDECWLLIEVLKVRSKGRGTGGALSIGHPGGPVNPFSGGAVESASRIQLRQNRLDIINTASPSPAADVLQGGPEAGVVGDIR